MFVSLAVLEKDRWRGVTILTAGAERVVAQSTEVAQLNLDLVAQINRTVASEGRDFAVFIAPGLDKFWEQNEICWAQSFLIPALTSQPLLKGLPPEKNGCEVTKHYGLMAYAKRDSASKMLDEPELCAAALEAGFASVLKFETRKSELVRCGSNSEEN